MNMLCREDSDEEEGIFGLREVGDIGDEEAATAFSSDDEDREEAEETGGVHMLTVAGNLLPRARLCVGPIGQLGGKS